MCGKSPPSEYLIDFKEKPRKTSLSFIVDLEMDITLFLSNNDDVVFATISLSIKGQAFIKIR